MRSSTSQPRSRRRRIAARATSTPFFGDEPGDHENPRAAPLPAFVLMAARTRIGRVHAEMNNVDLGGWPSNLNQLLPPRV